jgi:hypothetical protein
MLRKIRQQKIQPGGGSFAIVASCFQLEAGSA